MSRKYAGMGLGAGQLMVLLEERHAGQAWAFFPQVANGTGGHKSRTADALAMSLWPSRGLELHGFEVKVDRGDWLRELKNPAKAEAFVTYCDRWWIVAPGPGVAEVAELPPTWGMLHVVAGRLKVVQQAPKLDPKAINKVFLAGLLRAAQGYFAPDDQRKAEIEKARAEGHAAGVLAGKGEVDRGQRYASELREAVTKFEAASGLRIHDPWYAGQVGELVAKIRNLPAIARTRSEMERRLRGALAEAAQIDQILSGLSELEEAFTTAPAAGEMVVAP